MFCYKSVIETLQELENERAFKKCVNLGGKVIKVVAMVGIGICMMARCGRIFYPQMTLSVGHNYALQLNVDWFHPFEYTQYLKVPFISLS